MTPIEREVLSRYCEKLVYAYCIEDMDKVMEQASGDSDVPHQNFLVLVRLAKALSEKQGFVPRAPT